MKKTLIAIVLTGLFTSPVLAENPGGMSIGKDTGAAQGSHPGMGMGAGRSMEQMRATQQTRFRNIDGDQDGFISRTEAENHQRLMSNWGRADANADGKLDATEFSAFEEVVPPGAPR